MGWGGSLRARLGRGAAAGGILLGSATAVFARSGGESVLAQSGGRSYVVDIVLLVLLVAAALFAVCRSSNRS